MMAGRFVEPDAMTAEESVYRCRAFVMKLARDPFAHAVFFDPIVFPSADRRQQYVETVGCEPICLQDVLRGKYTSIVAMTDDLVRVFTNAISFNAMGVYGPVGQYYLRKVRKFISRLAMTREEHQREIRVRSAAILEALGYASGRPPKPPEPSVAGELLARHLNRISVDQATRRKVRSIVGMGRSIDLSKIDGRVTARLWEVVRTVGAVPGAPV